MDRRVNPIKLSMILLNTLFVLAIASLVMRSLVDRFKAGHTALTVTATAIATLCILAVIILAVRERQRTGSYPDSVEMFPGNETSVVRNFAFAALWALLLVIFVLSEVAATKTILAFLVPGASIVILFFWMIYMYPQVHALGVEGFRGGLRMGIFVFSTLAVATLLYAGAQDFVVGTISPYLAWAVAAVEASILVPLLMWVGRKIQDWVQDYLTPAPQIILPGRE